MSHYHLQERVKCLRFKIMTINCKRVQDGSSFIRVYFFSINRQIFQDILYPHCFFLFKTFQLEFHLL